MLATRSGSIAPGILISLLRQKGLDADQLDYTRNCASGLLGVSGGSSGMRQVLVAGHIMRTRAWRSTWMCTTSGKQSVIFVQEARK